ncbi:MAG: FYDLN acid domain-containing protein [Leptospiraceae bacterium]|jgi:uncharacterized protein (TIGR02300 family)|nr:FYDLN acid domain-containing protein [Leptospiraceae bacterium]MCZ8347360.1 FYDLN acid domain-containing protein [Leptospiraceae bacterium]
MAVKKKVTKPAPKKKASPASKKNTKSSVSSSRPATKNAPSEVSKPNKAPAKKTSATVAIDPKNPLGKKFSCYNCGTKFYDLNKADKICPKCGADQLAKPALKSKQAALKSGEYDVEEEEAPSIVNEDDDSILDDEEVEEAQEDEEAEETVEDE